MELKLFGKSLFEFKGTGRGVVFDSLLSQGKSESKFLPDFHTMASGGMQIMEWSNELTTISNGVTGQLVAVGPTDKAKEAAPEEKKPTPKEVYELKTIHDGEFKLNVDPEYVDAQLADFRDKLTLVSSEEYDMRRGVTELTSIVLRLENRKKYASEKDFFEQYPYTTTSKLDKLVADQKHLKLGQVAQFVADMPKDAVKAMKDYNAAVGRLCGKQAVFYVVADKKDFKQSNQRRDPILLAQSPFGHVWQILGAWDEEMMFLEQL